MINSALIITHPQTLSNPIGSTPERASVEITIVRTDAAASSTTFHTRKSDSGKSARLFTPPAGSVFSSVSRARLAAISAGSVSKTPLSASTERMSGF